MQIKALPALFSLPFLLASGFLSSQTIHLPTSKDLIGEIPGNPQRINSLPMSIAVSPDGRYIATINAGYGTRESDFEQSLAVLDTQTGQLADFPDDRTLVYAKQTLYSGLAFSHDGKRIYASIGSISDPLGKSEHDTGSGVVVYGFADGKVTQQGLSHLPMEPLAPGRKTLLPEDGESDKGIPFPAAIAVMPSADPAQPEKLLVADNLSDAVVLMDATTGAIEKHFDLSESDAVPGTFPVALAVTADGSRAFVALWNASEIAELDLAKGTVLPQTPACSNQPVPSPPAPTPAPLPSLPTARPSTSPSPTATRLPRSTSPPVSLT